MADPVSNQTVPASRDGYRRRNLAHQGRPFEPRVPCGAGQRARTLVGGATPKHLELSDLTPTMSLQREAYAAFLKEFAWTHFCTFTAPPTVDDKLRESLRVTLRKLEQRAQQAVTYLWVRERGVGGTPHLHVLLGGTAHLSRASIASAWPLGYADVQPFDAERGGVYYLTKNLFEEDGLWDLSRRIERPSPPSTTMFGVDFSRDDPDDPPLPL